MLCLSFFGAGTNGIDTYLNPDLAALSPLQCLDRIVAYCGSISLRVILVRTSAKADNFFSESSWFIPGDPYYSEAQFISDWVMLAKRYAGTAVVGADLWEQPRGTATWGSGASTDWDLAATRAGTLWGRTGLGWVVVYSANAMTILECNLLLVQAMPSLMRTRTG